MTFFALPLKPYTLHIKLFIRDPKHLLSSAAASQIFLYDIDYLVYNEYVITRSKKNNKSGKVYLVGAGPGDIGLLTLKGKECIERADVIIYDYLVNEEMLSCAQPDAERIFMGKHGGGTIIPQDKINRIMVAKARQDKIVVRLKGGDPFIYGRGGEEAEVLIDSGIPFEIVPGVTAGSAVPAYAGIPLTHRVYSSTIAFIPGHEGAAKKKSSIAWDKIATGVDTIVIFMGITTLPSIIANLVKYGRPTDTPIAVIQWGTTDLQKTVTGTLRNIANKVKCEGIRPPAIIVIGEVVRLRNRLKWFEKISAANSTILYTSYKADRLGIDISIAATARGICRIIFGNESSLLRELRSLYKNPVIQRNDGYFEHVSEELKNYFHGIPTNFTCKLDLHGTAFQKKVWKALLKIPYGKMASYREIAEIIGQPQASRAIGTACGKNPIPIITPCHRVISSDGSLGGYSGGIKIKKALLNLEGVSLK